MYLNTSLTLRAGAEFLGLILLIPGNPVNPVYGVAGRQAPGRYLLSTPLTCPRLQTQVLPSSSLRICTVLPATSERTPSFRIVAVITRAPEAAPAPEVI